MTTLIEIKGLNYARGDNCIFSGLSLSVPKGKITAIMGPSGTGKTTLLRVIGGQVTPYKGSVLFDGEEIVGLSPAKMDKLRRRMGLLFQEGALFTDLNVYENVAFLLREHTNLDESLIRDLVLMKLEAVGLRGAVDLQINELSGGMARRVALARAIMLDPELLMYDEPFTGQDPINRAVLLKLIRELNDALNITSIVVSHDVQEVIEVADYLHVIASGQVIASGEPGAVMASDDPKVQQFVKGLPDGPVPFRYPAKDFAEDLQID